MVHKRLETALHYWKVLSLLIMKENKMICLSCLLCLFVCLSFIHTSLIVCVSRLQPKKALRWLPQISMWRNWRSLMEHQVIYFSVVAFFFFLPFFILYEHSCKMCLCIGMNAPIQHCMLECVCLCVCVCVCVHVHTCLHVGLGVHAYMYVCV